MQTPESKNNLTKNTDKKNELKIGNESEVI